MNSVKSDRRATIKSVARELARHRLANYGIAGDDEDLGSACTCYAWTSRIVGDRDGHRHHLAEVVVDMLEPTS